MAAPAYGFMNRSGHYGAGFLSVIAAVGVLTTGEKDTGLDYTEGDVIQDVYVTVRTLEATATTKTIDVGLLSSESGGDTDGFLDGVVTSAVGTVIGAATVTTGSNTKFVASSTVGVLLADSQAGSDVDQDEGVFIRKRYAVGATAKSLVYQLGSAHTELVADIYVIFWRPNAPIV